MLAFLALLGAPYIYDISSLRVKRDSVSVAEIFWNFMQKLVVISLDFISMKEIRLVRQQS